jgi:hypothetical protein
VLFIDPPSDETLSSLADTAKQSPSDDDASSSEAQTRESFPATEETTLMPPVPSEPRNFSLCTQDKPPAVDHVSFSMITKLPPSPRRRSQREKQEKQTKTFCQRKEVEESCGATAKSHEG